MRLIEDAEMSLAVFTASTSKLMRLMLTLLTSMQPSCRFAIESSIAMVCGPIWSACRVQGKLKQFPFHLPTAPSFRLLHFQQKVPKKDNSYFCNNVNIYISRLQSIYLFPSISSSTSLKTIYCCSFFFNFLNFRKVFLVGLNICL